MKIKNYETLKFDKIFVKYKGEDELIDITDLNQDRYETFLALTALLNGRYLEVIVDKRIKANLFGEAK